MILARFEIGLAKIHASCQKRKYKPVTIAERVGRLKGTNSQAARRFHVEVEERDDGGKKISWTKDEPHRAWATLTDGCYVLRRNVKN